MKTDNKLFAIPYEMQRAGETPETAGARSGIILDRMCEHPFWFSTPMERAQIRESAAWLLTHPEHLKWEVWCGGQLSGMILLSRLTPGVDALLHFTLFGASLMGFRKLLWRFIGKVCFEELGLQRVSFELPENAETLVAFFRQRLAFRYEGELNLRGGAFGKYVATHLEDRGTSRKAAPAGQFHTQIPETALARLGSRREAAHWDADSKVWRDLLLLRLLKSEYLAHSTPRADSQATEDSPYQEPHVARSEASRLPADDAPRPSGAARPPD